MRAGVYVVLDAIKVYARGQPCKQFPTPTFGIEVILKKVVLC